MTGKVGQFNEIGHKVQLVVMMFVTNPEILKKGIATGAANSILLS